MTPLKKGQVRVLPDGQRVEVVRGYAYGSERMTTVCFDGDRGVFHNIWRADVQNAPLDVEETNRRAAERKAAKTAGGAA